MVRVDKQTLLRWLWAGKVTEPKQYEGAGVKVRLWTEHDVARVQRFKEANYRKGRGRKKKNKG